MMHSATDYVQQTTISHRPVVIWLAIAAGCLLVLAAIVGAPVALSSGHPLAGLSLYQAFSLVCHQIPERSFFIAGHQFAVCARCTGLYAGFSLVAIFYPLFRSLKQTSAPARKWLFIAALPLGIDFGLNFLGIWNNTHSSRFVTGALLGAVAVIYVMPGLLELGSYLSGKKQPRAAATISGITAPISGSAPSDYSAPHRRIST